MAKIENLYRGKIIPSQRFYLAARLNSNNSNTIKSALNVTINDPVFLLCLDKFERSGVNYHRFFWSCDPNDYVPNLYSNSYNQGALEMFYKQVNNNYLMYYESNLNSDSHNSNLNTFTMEKVSPANTIVNDQSDYFGIILHSDKYSLAPNVYSGVEYNIINPSNQSTQDWNFRKNNNSNGAIKSPPLSNYTSGNVNDRFLGCNRKAVKISGTVNTYNDNEMSISGFTTVTNFEGKDKIPSSGIVHMEGGVNSEYFSYSHYDPLNDIIFFDTRAMFGSTSFDPTGITITLTITLDNDLENFTNLSSIITNFDPTELPSPMEIFFIPEEKFSYFAGANSLATISNYVLTDPNAINYYNYETGNIMSNGYGIRAISFLTNVLQDTQPENFSTTTTDPKYPLIPVYDSSNTANTSTALVWTNRYESKNSYIYNHCTGSDLCGNCMGNTENNEYYCHVNGDTIPNYKASFGTTPADKPLSNNPKNSQLKNIYKNYTIPVFSIGIFVFISLLLIGFLIFERIKVDGQVTRLLKA